MFKQQEHRWGNGVILGGLVLKSSLPVTFPEHLLKLKRCFKSWSLLLAVMGGGYPYIQ